PITQTGTYSVVVANVSPGGGFSEKELLITNSNVGGMIPAIRADNPLSPSSQRAGSAGFTLTVFSSSDTFQADAWVNFGTVRLNRIAGDSSPYSITVFVPSYLIGSPGTVPVSVTNPGSSASTGGTSNRVYFTVTP